jgi:uncharacterized SAM-binding protein YcdF (DUF218 family)
MYRLLVGLLQPSTLLICTLLGIVVFAWARPQRRGLALRLLLAVSILQFCLATPFAGYLALLSLEGSAPPTTRSPTSKDTIVVLSGSVDVFDEDGKVWQLGRDSTERCLHALQLYKQAGGCQVVLSGGKVDHNLPGPTLAQAMRDFLVGLGADPDNLLLEDRSTTTYENAVYTRELLAKRGIAQVFLVTDRESMRRAAGCFQAQGLQVTPAPCGPVSTRLRWSVQSFLPSAEGMHAVDAANHEWLGILWYWLRGCFQLSRAG